MSTPVPTRTDALVIGGGPAGLSAALSLARFDRAVTVVDSGNGRSTFHQTNHNYLGFPDGISTVELRRLGRRQLAAYPKAQVVTGTVESLSGNADTGFRVRCRNDLEYHTRTLVLATGVVDHYPDFTGWQEYVGRTMFWCITCDGYENRGRDLVVVGNGDQAAGEAIQLRSLTDRVRLLTNADTDTFTEPFRERLDKLGVPVIHDRITGAVGEGGLLRALETAGGDTLTLEALFSVQGATPRGDLAAQLGVRCDDEGWIIVDTEQQTSVPGVYAAGDVTALHSHQVSVAVHEGAQAACAANYLLYPADLKVESAD